MWKPKDNATLKEWVEAVIDEASDDLNDWETNFIEDMRIKIEAGMTLTQAQEEKLEKIYANKTS